MLCLKQTLEVKLNRKPRELSHLQREMRGENFVGRNTEFLARVKLVEEERNGKFHPCRKPKFIFASCLFFRLSGLSQIYSRFFSPYLWRHTRLSANKNLVNVSHFLTGPIFLDDISACIPSFLLLFSVSFLAFFTEFSRVKEEESYISC